VLAIVCRSCRVAAMELQITQFRVDVEGGDGLTFPCITLLNRRGGGAPVRLRWVFQRSLEILLFHRTDGGSTGAIWKALNNSGLQSTSLLCCRKAVNEHHLLDAELQQIMETFKASLPAGMCDPSALGRIRSCTLLPLATAAAVCRQHGRSPASMAFLRAFSQQVPTGWELQEEAEEDAANGVYDYVLHDKLDDHGFEAEDLSIAQELTQVTEFVDLAEDETKLRSYALTPTANLKRQLAAFVSHRTATFAARRSGGAIQSASAEANCTALLRFFGWMHRLKQVPADAMLDIGFFARPDLGTKAEQWAGWLQQSQRIRFTSICNYLSSLVSIANYVYFELHVDDEVIDLSPNPLEQLVNLRDQAHGAIKEQNLYTPANVKGGWISWPQAQETRVKIVSAARAHPPAATLKEASMISLMTLIPPDRVGVIRRLRFQHTLKRRESCWVVDLSRRSDGHKTSKHYGPFHCELPVSLNDIIDAYRDLLTLEPGGDAAYLFSPNDCLDRPLESSAWNAAVKRMFKKHFGQEISPKALRSSFITWLRDSTSCPEVLKSAAHAQKHSERRQSSDSYDAERDTRRALSCQSNPIRYPPPFPPLDGPDAHV
jgi:integrase